MKYPIMDFPVLVVSDPHVHERRGRNRIAEVKAMVAKTVALLDAKGLRGEASLVVTGDMYDRNTPVSIETTLLLADWFRAFKRVYLLVGNHDTPIRSTTLAMPEIFKMMGVAVIKQTTPVGDCLFVPYFDSVVPAQMGSYRYIFAHKDIKELNGYCDAEYGVSMTDFPPARAVFNGHLHANAAYQHGDGVFVQVGSPYPTTWSDDYRLNRFCYLLQPESFEAFYLNITADADAPDAEQFMFTRQRKEAGATDEEEQEVLAGLQGLREDDMSIESALSLCDGIDPMVIKLIRSVISRAPQTIDPLRL